MNCPRCGGNRVKVELRAAGTKSSTEYYRHGVKSSWFVPAGRRSYHSTRKQKSVGLCQDCGYHWDIDSSEKGCLFYLLCLLFLPITLSVLFYRSSVFHLEKKWKALILATVWVVVFIFLMFNKDNITAPPNDGISQDATQIWATEYTSLDDFDYYIDGNEIVLKEYTGRSKRVYVAPSYEYEGRTLVVRRLEGVFALDSIDSVIISEGITAIANNAFNSCGIKYLYLPSTLTDFSGWSYFHDADKLFYGGNAEAWHNLCPEDRSEIDFVDIIYSASISSLMGK